MIVIGEHSRFNAAKLLNWGLDAFALNTPKFIQKQWKQ